MTANIEDSSCQNKNVTKFPIRNNTIKPLLKQTTSFVESNDNFVKRKKDVGRRLSFSDEVGQNLTEYYTIERRTNKGKSNLRFDDAESSKVCCIS